MNSRFDFDFSKFLSLRATPPAQPMPRQPGNEIKDTERQGRKEGRKKRRKQKRKEEKEEERKKGGKEQTEKGRKEEIQEKKT